MSFFYDLPDIFPDIRRFYMAKKQIACKYHTFLKHEICSGNDAIYFGINKSDFIEVVINIKDIYFITGGHAFTRNYREVI